MKTTKEVIEQYLERKEKRGGVIDKMVYGGDIYISQKEVEYLMDIYLNDYLKEQNEKL